MVKLETKIVKLSQIYYYWKNRPEDEETLVDFYLEAETTKVVSLMESIQKEGIKEPLMVIPFNYKCKDVPFLKREEQIYLLIDGYHRFFIAKKLGIEEVPIRFLTEEEMILAMWLKRCPYRLEGV